MNAPQRLTLPLRAPLLDRRLLAGADPSRDPALESRGRRLCSQRRRERLAADLERAVEAAGSEPERTGLLGLARRLRADAPVDPQGVLLARRLLTDPASPLTADAPAGALGAAVRRANAALNLR